MRRPRLDEMRIFHIRILTFKHTTNRSVFYPTKNIERHIYLAFLLELYWILPLAFNGGRFTDYLNTGLFCIMLIALLVMYPKAHSGNIFSKNEEGDLPLIFSAYPELKKKHEGSIRRILISMREFDDTILRILIATLIFGTLTALFVGSPEPFEYLLATTQVLLIIRASSLTWLTIPSELEAKFHEVIEETRDT